MDNNEDILINCKGVLVIIFITVLFPDINEIEAYHNCKRKLEVISELLALRNYGKNKTQIMKEILNIKEQNQLREYVDKIYEKYIFQQDVINILNNN